MSIDALTPEQHDEICERYQREDTSLRKLAHQYRGVDHEDVRQLLLSRGIPRRAPTSLADVRANYLLDRRRERTAGAPRLLVLPPGSVPAGTRIRMSEWGS
jgi:hypothetical protein